MTVLARWCFKHRLAVVGLWLALLAAISVPTAVLGTAYSDAFSLPGTESAKAQTLLQAAAPQQAGDTDQIVVHVNRGSVRDTAVRQQVDAMLAKVAALPSVTSVTGMYGPEGAAQISRDERTAYATVTFDAPADRIPAADVTRVIDTAQAARTPDLQVELGGQAVADASDTGTQSTELIALMAAGVVLLLAFGSVLGALVPLLVATAGLGAGVLTVGLLSHGLTLGSIAPTVTALLGLGVGIDYALFIVTRYRTNLRAGLSAEEAAVRAMATSGRAVLFAGGTVVVALLGLLVLHIGPLTGMGISAAIGVLATLAAAMTLLPALLGLFGARLLSKRQRRALASHGPQIADASGFWGRWADLVGRRKTVLGLIAVVVIAVLSIPTLSLRLGTADAGNDPKGTTTRSAYDLLAQGFGVGSNGPLVLVAQLGGPGDVPRLDALVTTLAHTPGVASAQPLPVAPGSGLDVIQVIPDSAPQAKATTALISHLRTDVIPPAEHGSTMRVHVGGPTAAADDLAGVLAGKLPLFLAVIVALGCALLMLAFRSVLVPLTAAVMNLLASAASFGVVVAVFQWGWGSEQLGVGKAGPVEAILPLIMLAILFGLSMDYQVFLVSRMHEEWEHTRDNHRAVRTGQAETGRVITAAALIMICVFTAFVLGGQRVIAEFGVGLGAAVAIDALVLRTLLVPAVMHLLSRANWWLPGPLERLLPRLSVEGTSRPTHTPAAGPDDATRTGPAGAPTGVTRPTATAPAHPRRSRHRVTPRGPKSLWAAWSWWFFLGLFGAHWFYLGRTRRGVLYLCTAGLCGLGWLADPLTLARQVHAANDGHADARAQRLADKDDAGEPAPAAAASTSPAA
ncbi:MMPL family transporter [Streptomyces sp. NPDC001093]|uniref:MMPL family transporter n=1 Tax=Streptomyces sp. NPDC001093 TaxID=3154376 RepID=UPI00332D350E